jgi:hypothetical protein
LGSASISGGAVGLLPQLDQLELLLHAFLRAGVALGGEDEVVFHDGFLVVG